MNNKGDVNVGLSESDVILIPQLVVKICSEICYVHSIVFKVRGRDLNPGYPRWLVGC